jgi:large subunit ribosomal protein L7/L12
MSAHTDLVRCLDIQDLADRLMSLTLAEAAALREHLDEFHGIRPTVRTVCVEEKQPPPPAPEPSLFTVVLQGLTAPEKKIGVFKAVRALANLGLKETRELVESAPAVVKTSLLKDEAEDVKQKLEAAGARIVLAPVSDG